jgi:hypothetical protein
MAVYTQLRSISLTIDTALGLQTAPPFSFQEMNEMHAARVTGKCSAVSDE